MPTDASVAKEVCGCVNQVTGQTRNQPLRSEPLPTSSPQVDGDASAAGAGFRQLARLDARPAGLAKVRKLCEARASGGKVYLYRRGDQPLVLKIAQTAGLRRDWDERTKDLLTEIGVLRLLTSRPHRHIVALVAAFSDQAEGTTVLATEHCDGGVLIERVSQEGPLAEAKVKTYMAQLLSAVRHLHESNIGHRDVSTENILLQKGVLKLADFGLAAAIRGSSGALSRYFALVGKNVSRAPEMYVPMGSPEVVIVCPEGAAPSSVVQMCYRGCQAEVRIPESAVPGQECVVEFCGYRLQPVDVFSVGVFMVALAWCVPPWKHALHADPSYSFVQRNGWAALLGGHWKKTLLSPSAMRALEGMTNADPDKRWSLDEVFTCDWLAGEAEPSDTGFLPSTAGTSFRLEGEGGDVSGSTPSTMALGKAGSPLLPRAKNRGGG